MKKSFLFSFLVAFTLFSHHNTSPFLIAGTRNRKTKEGRLSSKCLICSKDNDINMKAYSIRHWFTLFFIPVAPYGKKKYYLKCTQCKNYYRPAEGIDIEKIIQEDEPQAETSDIVSLS